MINLCYDNIVYALQPAGGISVYWSEITKYMLNNKHVNIRFIETGYENDNISRRELKLPIGQTITVKRGNLFTERFQRVTSCPNEHNAVFHSSYFRMPLRTNKIKKVCTVHDFVHEKYFRGPRLWLHNYLKRKAILESDAIITVSQNTKKDLLEYYPQLPSSKVTVIYNGVSNAFNVILKDKNNTHRSPYLLFIGSRYSYKNFDYAVKLTAKLPDYQLYVVGSSFNKTELSLIEATIPGKYKLWQRLSTSELNILYNNAFSLVYPSVYEGFGIPLGEAMHAGCPFIALNNSSIPEVAGKAGILLETLVVEEGIAAVNKIEKNRDEIIKKGLEQARLFSWEKCASQTLDLYKTI